MDPNEGLPEAAELGTIRPAFALILIGTNDWALPFRFRERITYVVDTALALGVIPVLSTMPDDLYGGGVFEPQVLANNQIIADVAHERDIPLLNYWRALQPLPNLGISSDGTHPSSSILEAGNFTDVGLLSGFNVRNLTAVQVLDKLLRVVVLNGSPDFVYRPLTAPTIQYVTSLYDTLLGRPPDPGGLNLWGEQLEQGASPQQVAQEIWQSAEHRALEVNQYYTSYLHRLPGAAEQAGWVQAFLAGASEEQVRAAILAAPEYQAAQAGSGDLVTGLYHDVLGRTPDAAGQAGWEQALQDGLDPRQVVLAFLQSPEGERRDIESFYQSFFQRPADPGGQQYWLDQLNQGHLALEGVGEAMLATEAFQAGP